MQAKLIGRLGIFLIAIFLSLAVLAPTVFADGAVNGSSIPGTNGSSYVMGYGGWNSGWWGARVTLVDAVSGVAIDGCPSIDYTYNTSFPDGKYEADDPEVKSGAHKVGDSRPRIPIEKAQHFGGYCKSDYRDWKTLELIKGGYTRVSPPYAKDKEGKPIGGLPRMLYEDETHTVDMAAVKAYFSNRNVIDEFVAAINTQSKKYTGVELGLTHQEVTSGKYKFMVEPIAYLNFPGTGLLYAATVTELGLWNKATPERKAFTVNIGYIAANWGGDYYYDGWPRSLFLEKDDIGFTAWNDSDARYEYSGRNSSGVRTRKYNGVTNEQIISQMGIITISWDDDAPKVYYHLYTSTRTPDKPLTEMDSLSLAEQLANSKETKHAAT